MTLKVVDRFTTRDGKWDVDPRPYGLTKDKLYQYNGWNIPGKGGAAHIFVKAPVGSEVVFFTRDGRHVEPKTVDSSGWCNFNLWASSAFWGENGGPWNVRVNGVEVATGLGLPEGLHVSTFLIVEDVDSGSQPKTIMPTPMPGHYTRVVVQDMADGIVEREQVIYDSRAKGGSQ